MVSRRAIVVRPLLVWAAMLALAAVSLGYALLPGAPAKLAVSLAVVAAQASLVLGLFMNLRRAGPLVRMTALIGVVWLSFLFILSAADFWTR